jgi:tRNA threonylcarbamoyl adenosine modification protein YjeE
MAPAAETGRSSVALPDEAATARLAQDIAAMLLPGDLVALSGELGAGKTTFARALLRALAGDLSLEVPSPTFPLRIDHVLPRLEVMHADLYRVREADEIGEIGLDEALADSALLVEWPERLPEKLSANRLDVRLAIARRGRSAEIVGEGSWPERLARTKVIREFLDRSGWSGAARIPLAGDASTRAYERILRPDATAILMNAPASIEGPPIHGGRSYDAVAHRALDVRPFLAIGEELRRGGVRVPQIYAAEMGEGLLLLEDLGGESVLDASGRPILERYEAAIDLLVHMHGRSWPAEATLPGRGVHRVPPYDRGALLVEISLFPDWYGPIGGEPGFPADAREDFLAAWSAVLDQIAGGPTTWVLRDFHSPNILWQAHATGTDRVGVLDFQDALIGDPAYDVASLAQDARAPLTEEDELRLKSRYVAGRRAADPSFDAQRFEIAYAVLAAQRATKVLGAFSRLARVGGKPGYQRHQARLEALLRRTLAHPVLSPLRVWYEPRL